MPRPIIRTAITLKYNNVCKKNHEYKMGSEFMDKIENR